MRKTIGALASVMALCAVPGVAHASTFYGSCDPIKGVATFGSPLKADPVANTYSFTGTATCQGTFNGQEINDAVHVVVQGAGNLGCSHGDSTEGAPGIGTITDDRTGQSIDFTMAFHAIASEVFITLGSTKSGSGFGHASFASSDPQANANTLSACNGDGVSSLAFTASAFVPQSSPLDDGKAPQPAEQKTEEDKSDTTTTTSSSPTNNSASTQPSTTGSPTSTGAQRDTAAPRARSVRVKGRRLSLVLSEPARLTGTITRRGHRVARLSKRLGTGRVSVRLPRLRHGRYVIAFRLTDAAGNRSALRKMRVRL